MPILKSLCSAPIMRPTYLREGVICVLDRSRGYLVKAAPEELVRQDTLDWLIDDHKVPASLVRSEFNTRSRGGAGRADIVVFRSILEDDPTEDAVLVVECKRHHVFLEERTEAQAQAYARTVNAPYILLTDGKTRHWFARDGRQWRKLSRSPTWREMFKRRGLRWESPEQYERYVWDEIDTPAKCRKILGAPGESELLGEKSPPYLASFALNLFGCLSLATNGLTLPLIDDRFAIIRDIGTRTRWFGNVSGGTWSSDNYRGFLVKEMATGTHQVVSLTLMACVNGRTYFLVAVDDGPSSHLSLQMDLDCAVRDVDMRGGTVHLQHDGRMTAGKGGAVSRNTVLAHMRGHAPHLLAGTAISLGTLPTNRLIQWSSARDFLQRAVRYALERDNLRQTIKAERKQVGGRRTS